MTGEVCTRGNVRETGTEGAGEWHSEALSFRFDALRPIGASEFQSQRISPGMVFDTPIRTKKNK